MMSVCWKLIFVHCCFSFLIVMSQSASNSLYWFASCLLLFVVDYLLFIEHEMHSIIWLVQLNRTYIFLYIISIGTIHKSYTPFRYEKSCNSPHDLVEFGVLIFRVTCCPAKYSTIQHGLARVLTHMHSRLKKKIKTAIASIKNLSR